MKLYSTSEAASYLGVSVSTLKKHMYILRTLVPDAKIGQTLVFTRETLDHWQANRRKSGRPPKR